MGGWVLALLAPPLLSLVSPQQLASRGLIMAAPQALQILRANGLLLTRIQHNCPAGLAGCSDVVIYNHGFPDSSVVPTAVQDFAAASAGAAEAPADSYFSSRLPRKWCEYLMKQLPDTAFVAFNTRGVPGSSLTPPARVEDAPDNFASKTLTGDLEDIRAMAAFMRAQCPLGRIAICGMSTGAFLALAFAASPDLHPPGGIAGCFTLACVQDIPSAASLDFSEEQLAAFDSDGFCLKEFFPSGGENNPQLWMLSRAYYESYAKMPSADEVTERLAVPTLLLHGSDDKHVPPSHGEALLQSLQQNPTARVELVLLAKGNHFLSSTAPLNKALAAIKKFMISLRGSASA